MSIINDALNKATQERDKKIQAQDATAVEMPAQEASKQTAIAPVKKNNFLRIIIIAGIILASLTALFIALGKIPSKESASPGLKINNLNLSIPRKPAIYFDLTLDGIVHGQGAPMAIINGSVYMVGDEVKSAKIIEISDNAVILEKNNSKIELKVKQ